MSKPQFERFQKWTPDQGTFGTGQSELAEGVIRTRTGFRPFPGLVDTNNDEIPGPITDPILKVPVGLFFSKTRVGNAEPFVAVFNDNDRSFSRIFELSGDGQWTEASTWEIATETRFRTVQWEDTLYLTHFDGTDTVNGVLRERVSPAPDFYAVPYREETYQSAPWDVATAYVAGDQVFYADVDPRTAWQAVRDNTGVTPTEGADWTEITETIPARYIAVIRDFLVLGGLKDPAFTVNGIERGGLHPDRVRWSSIRAPSDFSLEGDAATLSGFQDVPDAGEIRGIVGGEYGVVLTENGLFRMDFVGPPAIFSFNRIERARGCIEPNSVIVANNIVYYLSDDGWKSFDGQSVRSFGAEKFDRYFRTTATQSKLKTMSAFVDPNNQLVVWGFSATKSVVDINDSVLIYNYAINEATHGLLDHSILGSFVTPTLNIDGVDTALVSGLAADEVFRGKWSSITTYTVAAGSVNVVSHDSPPVSGNTSGDSVAYRALFENTNEEPEPDNTNVNWQRTDTWITGTQYALGDVVYDPNGTAGLYLAIATPGTTNDPSATPAEWQLVAYWDPATAYTTGQVVITTGDNPEDPNIAYSATTTTTPGNSPGVNRDNEWAVFQTPWQKVGVTAPVTNLQSIPWDSTIFKEGAQIFGAISRKSVPNLDKLHVFSGFAPVSTIDTQELRPGQGRSRIQRVQLAIEGDQNLMSVRIGSRNALNEKIKWSPFRSLAPDQSYKFNEDARYHRFQVQITGTWRDATGVFYEAEPTGDH